MKQETKKRGFWEVRYDQLSLETEQNKELVKSIVNRLQSQNEELTKALQDIVNNWVGEEPFKDEPLYKTHNDGIVGEFGYWSPAGKPVKAELIAKAKSILKDAGLTDK